MQLTGRRMKTPMIPARVNTFKLHNTDQRKHEGIKCGVSPPKQTDSGLCSCLFFHSDTNLKLLNNFYLQILNKVFPTRQSHYLNELCIISISYTQGKQLSYFTMVSY